MTEVFPTFARILVPIDFVDIGEESATDGALVVSVEDHRILFTSPTLRAVALATSLGQAYGATVRLLHATPPLQTNSIYSGPVSLPTGLIEEINDRASTMSTAVLRQLEPRFGSGVTLEYAVRPGTPLLLVLEEAESFGADLIVLAASGRSRVARFFVGSTADRLVRQAPCPVLVVPANE